MLMHFMAFSLDNLCLLVNTTQLDEELFEKTNWLYRVPIYIYNNNDVIVINISEKNVFCYTRTILTTSVTLFHI